MTTKRPAALVLAALIVIVSARFAFGDTFGSGVNAFDLEFVVIGNAGNAQDTTGTPNPAGALPYRYRMGKFEVSRDMVMKANGAGGLGITMASIGGDRAEMAASGITWFEAATFVNWLNTSTGHAPAYKFDGNAFELWQSGDAGYNSANLFRNRNAFYFLPSTDEWYKAAFYDPQAGVYYDYPTGSDTAPTPVAGGTAANTAVFQQPIDYGPADIMLAGGLSHYGTMGQGGNVWEWEETELDLVNDSTSSTRGLRGGAWSSIFFMLRATGRIGGNPSFGYGDAGFRVASIAAPVGDYNDDGTVDAADYVVWRKTDGTPEGFATWRAHFGQTTGTGSAASANATVPEPATLVMLIVVVAGGLSSGRGWRTWRVSKLINA
jgi:formylglycine-generating enzyme required for sulfatase activity